MLTMENTLRRAEKRSANYRNLNAPRKTELHRLVTSLILTLRTVNWSGPGEYGGFASPIREIAFLIPQDCRGADLGD